MFEKASRKKYRFDSTKGELTVEQLWDLPLQSRNGCDLDDIAKGLNAELKTSAEESFVEVVSSPRKTELEDKFEIVKHIIGVRLAENKARLEAAERKDEIARLQEILAGKKDEAVKALSPEEIEARILALRS